MNKLTIETPRAAIGAPSLGRQNLFLGLAFLIIIVVSAMTFYSAQQLVVVSDRVERSQALLIEVHHYVSEIKDVESRSRGYFVTGDERFLKDRAKSVANARLSAERLKTIPAASALRTQLDRLIAIADERLTYSNRLVAERGAQTKAVETIRLGTNVMDQVRSEAEMIVGSQTRIYRAEQRALRRQVWLTGIALAAGVFLCLTIIAWLFAIRGREVESRRQLEEELRGLNLELEDRVEERTAEVKRAGDLLNAVVENLPDMVLLKEPSGGAFRYVLANAAAEKLLGRDRSEIVGRAEKDLFPPEEAALVVQTNKAVVESGMPRTFMDRKLTTPSGVKTVETRVVPILNGASERGLILAIIRDVTDHKAREEQLRQLQRMDAIGRLTGGVAHDFNNLLAVVYGNSEVLRDRIANDPDALEMVDDVMGAASRGAELVRRLLAFARMQHLDPEPVDLNARLSSIVGLLQRVIGEEVSLQVKAGEGLWPAIIDPTQVDDALVNLAINARDAMPDGGALTIETGNVHFDAESAANYGDFVAGEYVMLAVSDTGSGMSPETIARAFEPFFTTKEEGKGTGLGLSQVFGWVKQSGGHIKIYSELGHGTTVKLYLPRAQAEISATPKAAEVMTPRGNEMILVVEDNANVRKTVIRQLHDLGYRTMEAECGSRALELARNETFDLLLTDVIMPGGITGYQLADELRETRPNLKVLFTSGYTELANAGDHKPRTDGLLSKPYRKQDLGRAIRVALDVAGGANPATG